IPEASNDHAERVLSFGRSMLASLDSVDLDEVPFRIRIGIHTGPVVAGLLGRHRFVYDVWGEAVNIASRLESQCAPGCVLISAATRQALTSDWPVKPQGLLDLKGIGGVSAFVVTA
ncbi:MAG TPA: adenylate/guanylate cyclase domain-containing protein, partial [Thermohalobaculum sp.]|nr:adenylate/guanylate cyclase domain-containing protein [Thermohalobaculum sp.]